MRPPRGFCSSLRASHQSKAEIPPEEKTAGVSDTAGMNGTDKNTGKTLSATDHLRQSIVDVLTTPIGSRVMRREYGSRLFELVDKPLNAETLVDMYAASAEALQRWEPRLRVLRVLAQKIDNAQVTLDLTAEDLSGQAIQIDSINLN